MRPEMEKTYDHARVESALYKKWEEHGYFHARPNTGKPPYTIVIPPPNITGKLHMGHAIDETLQDVLIRYKRMSGYEALWMPGTDHASIATEVKIVEQMAKEGITKKDIGREAFLKRAWAWREEYGSTIVKQLRYLGSSCDWERERFTMDEGCSKAVTKVFVSLYKKGLIYRGDRIINWCPDCKTALSDAEVEYEEQKSHLWHVRYDAPDKSYSITVATTRPETMLGDTAVAVNPEDPRYKDLLGKMVVIPAVGREIPIIGDEYCEMEFGTGAVKITPGHDPNDFEVGQRHGLPTLRVYTDSGIINDLGGKYEGMDRFECRKAIVKDLEESGNLIKIEPYSHNVGTCYRCHTTIEPIVSKQWFVSMKQLAEPAIAAVKNGDIKFVPERFEKTYFNWMDNIRDWCISRQLWWGHRIPAYYCDSCGKMIVAEEAPDRCPDCGGAVRQDEDVLDTWFSSGMWPFSTLGYPEQTEELKYFYPTDTLVTGYDIIFFWVARMIVFGYEVMHEKPFSTVYVHGIMRDSQGRKMSKSLGNGIDPLEVIEKHGADSLRFSLLAGNSAGNDMRFYWEKVESARNFCNKIYNAARFVLMGVSDPEAPLPGDDQLEVADRWILSRLNEVIGEVTRNLDGYELGLAAQKIYDFIWSEYCDWYIEIAKSRLYSEDANAKAAVSGVLVYVLKASLKLLHPFMPFITEEIFTNLTNEETIMLSDWPKQKERFSFENDCFRMNRLMDLVRAIRNLRAEMKVPPAQKIDARLIVDPSDVDSFGSMSGYLGKLAGVEHVSISTEAGEIPQSDVHIVCEGVETVIPLSSLIDPEKEKARIQKEIERVSSDIARAESKLSNEGFLAKAPQNVINEEKGKLSLAREMLIKLQERLAMLK
ncbi:MAG: valine--tRNA ligase [Eubacteriales bacterium]|nr:valine--tRNA ligase [Eubacteriales bacterium]